MKAPDCSSAHDAATPVDLVHLFKLAEQVFAIVAHTKPLLIPSFLDLMLRWNVEGRPSSLCSSDDDLLSQVLRIHGADIESISTHCVELLEATAPLLLAADRLRATTAIAAAHAGGTHVH